jgi:hypothetical protein
MNKKKGDLSFKFVQTNKIKKQNFIFYQQFFHVDNNVRNKITLKDVRFSMKCTSLRISHPTPKLISLSFCFSKIPL